MAEIHRGLVEHYSVQEKSLELLMLAGKLILLIATPAVLKEFALCHVRVRV